MSWLDDAEESPVRNPKSSNWQDEAEAIAAPKSNFQQLKEHISNLTNDPKGIHSEAVVPAALKAAIDASMRVLGGVGGAVRTGIAQTLAPSVTRPGDIKRTAMLDAPLTSEYLERAGVGPGLEVSDVFPSAKGKAFDFSARGAAGLVGDTLTDPLMYSNILTRLAKVTRGAKGIPPSAPSSAATELATESRAVPSTEAIPKEARIVDDTAPSLRDRLANAVEKFRDFKPLTNASPDLGIKLYRNALADVDRSFSKRKAFMGDLQGTPFSDLAYKEGFLPSFSSPAGLEEATVKHLQGPTLGEKYNKIYASPEAEILRLDPTEAARRISPWLQKKFELGATRPDVREIIEQAQLERETNPQGLNLRQSQELGTNWYNQATGKVGSNGDALKRLARTDTYKEGMGRMAKANTDYRNEAAANAGIPGAEELPELDRRFSVLKTAEKTVNDMRNKAQGKKWFTQIDAPIAAVAGMGALMHEPKTAAFASALLAAEGATRFLNSPGGGVTGGNAVRAFGKMSPWDKLLKQGLLNQPQYEENQQ